MKVHITSIYMNDIDVSTPTEPHSYMKGSTSVNFDLLIESKAPIRLNGTLRWYNKIDEEEIVKHIKKEIYDSITEDKELSEPR